MQPPSIVLGSRPTLGFFAEVQGVARLLRDVVNVGTPTEIITDGDAWVAYFAICMIEVYF